MGPGIGTSVGNSKLLFKTKNAVVDSGGGDSRLKIKIFAFCSKEGDFLTELEFGPPRANLRFLGLRTHHKVLLLRSWKELPRLLSLSWSLYHCRPCLRPAPHPEHMAVRPQRWQMALFNFITVQFEWISGVEFSDKDKNCSWTGPSIKNLDQRLKWMSFWWR